MRDKVQVCLSVSIFYLSLQHYITLARRVGTGAGVHIDMELGGRVKYVDPLSLSIAEVLAW